MILALPAVAIFKIVCDNIDSLKPVGKLLSSDIYQKPKLFYKDYDESKYRLYRLFLAKKSKPVEEEEKKEQNK